MFTDRGESRVSKTSEKKLVLCDKKVLKLKLNVVVKVKIKIKTSV